MMKRSDQTNWTQRELVSAKLLSDNSGGGIGEGAAAAITRKIIEDEYNGGIGAGGGGGTIDANLTFIGNVSERIKTFKVIGNTTTDAQGEFTFNFDQTGISEIFSVDVRTFLLTDEGLDPQERIVDCYVTQTVGSTVSGAAFFNRRVGPPDRDWENL